jgi:hypothetical protein
MLDFTTISVQVLYEKHLNKCEIKTVEKICGRKLGM